MSLIPRSRFAATLGVAACLLCGSCATSTAPAPPKAKPGTPAFFWISAREAMKQGDYVRAQSLLADLSAGSSEYSVKARPLAAVLTHGITHGYMDLAETYAAGAKRARTNEAMFRRLTGEYRAKAKAAAMRYAEVARLLNADVTATQNVVLAFQFPEGPATDPGQYKKLLAGTPIPPAEAPGVETHVLKHEVMLTALVALGAPENIEKGRSLYQNGEAAVPAATYLAFLGRALYETSDMFGPKRLNQPSGIRSLLLREAATALTKAPETAETKDLLKKVRLAEKELAVS